MSFLSRLFARATPARLEPRAMTEGAVIRDTRELADFIRAGFATTSGIEVNAEKAMTLAAVYRSVTLVSGVVANVPLRIKREGENRMDEERDDPVATLFRRRPNRWQKRGVFMRMMNAHLMLRGNCYAMKVRGRDRRVVELIPLHPDRVEVRQLDDLSIVYTFTRPDGRTVTLPQSEVFHVMIHTFDGVKGVSPLHYAREAIGSGIGVERHGAAMWRNGTNIGSVLHTENSLTDDQVGRLKESLERFRGAENAHKTLVLEAGLKWEPIGMSLADAQFIESRRFSRGDIAMFFGVPPHMLGDAEASDGSGRNLEERSRAFVQFTIEDYFTAWEDAIDADLLEDEALLAQFKRTALIRGDLAARAKWYQSGLQWGYLSPDEVRLEEGLNPRDDGTGGVFYPPPNMTAKPGQEPEGDASDDTNPREGAQDDAS